MHMFGVKHTCIAPPKICGFYCLNWFCASTSTATSIIHCINQCTTQPTGAWWLGYLVPALIVLLFSVPIMFFPQQMPAAKVRRTTHNRPTRWRWWALGAFGGTWATLRHNKLYHLRNELPNPRECLMRRSRRGSPPLKRRRKSWRRQLKNWCMT